MGSTTDNSSRELANGLMIDAMRMHGMQGSVKRAFLSNVHTLLDNQGYDTKTHESRPEDMGIPTDDPSHPTFQKALTLVREANRSRTSEAYKEAGEKLAEALKLERKPGHASAVEGRGSRKGLPELTEEERDFVKDLPDGMAASYAKYRGDVFALSQTTMKVRFNPEDLVNAFRGAMEEGAVDKLLNHIEKKLGAEVEVRR